MPSLNPRTPSPMPRISSGILRPPKSTRITTRMISQCIGNSISPPATQNSSKIALNCALPRNSAQKPKLQYNTLIAQPAGQALPVEVLQQGYSVLPGYTGQVLETGNSNPVAPGLLVRQKLGFQMSKSRLVENQLRRDAEKVFIPQQNLQHLLRALGFDRQSGKHLFHGRHRQSRRSKGRFNFLFGGLFVGLQGDAASGALYDLAL